MNRHSSLILYVTAVIILIVSLTIRFSSYHIVTADYTASLSHWMDALRGAPGLTAFENQFSNYSPLYLYLLKLLTLIPVNELYAIKTLSLIFDALLVFMMVKIVAFLRPSYSKPWLFFLGALAFIIPTMLLNSSVWGQCDSIYAFFTLWSLYLLLKHKPYWATVALGIAISFKLQAIFFLPVFVGFIMARKRTSSALLLLPFVYLLTVIPAWLSGGSFVKLATIYFAQSQEFNDLTLFAPSIFAFIGNSIDSSIMVSILSHLGQVIAIALSAAIMYLVSRLIRNDSLSPQALVLVSVFTLIALPFFLPHMHEKYFYLADMVAITYAFIRPSKWYIPVLVISASTLSYMPFLSGAIPEFGKFVTSVAFGAVLILIALASLFPRIRAKWMDVILQKSPRLVNQPIINNY